MWMSKKVHCEDITFFKTRLFVLKRGQFLGDKIPLLCTGCPSDIAQNDYGKALDERDHITDMPILN